MLLDILDRHLHVSLSLSLTLTLTASKEVFLSCMSDDLDCNVQDVHVSLSRCIVQVGQSTYACALHEHGCTLQAIQRVLQSMVVDRLLNNLQLDEPLLSIVGPPGPAGYDLRVVLVDKYPPLVSRVKAAPMNSDRCQRWPITFRPTSGAVLLSDGTTRSSPSEAVTPEIVEKIDTVTKALLADDSFLRPKPVVRRMRFVHSEGDDEQVVVDFSATQVVCQIAERNGERTTIWTKQRCSSLYAVSDDEAEAIRRDAERDGLTVVEDTVFE